MSTYGVAEAKSGLPGLINRALATEEVIITRHGKPVVEIRPAAAPGPADPAAFYERLASRRLRPKGPPITSVEPLMVSDFAMAKVTSGLARRVRTDVLELDAAVAGLAHLDARRAAFTADLDLQAGDVRLANVFVRRFNLGLTRPRRRPGETAGPGTLAWNPSPT